MTERQAQAEINKCRASYEAVVEQEEIFAESGCPICGRPAVAHDSELPRDEPLMAEDEGC